MPRVGKLAASLWIAWGIATWGGCDRGDVSAVIDAENDRSPSVLEDREGFIAVVASGKDDPYWPIIQAGAQRYHDDLGMLELRYCIPAGNSPKDQIDLLKSLKDPKLRGICIHPTSEDAILPVLAPLHGRGIPIVTMLQPLACDWPISHVGLNDNDVGQALAELTALALDERGTLMLLHAGIEHDVYGPRRRSFLEHLQRYRELELFADIDAGRSPRQARTVIRERSQRFPRLDAWVCLDDWPLRDFQNPASLFEAPTRLITVGGTPQHIDLIRRGISPGVVAADYYELGSHALRACHVALLDGEQFRPIRIELPLRVVTANTLTDYVRDWQSWAAGEMPESGANAENPMK